MNTILNPGQLLNNRVEKLRIIKVENHNSSGQGLSGLPDPTGFAKQVDRLVSGMKEDGFELQINPEKYEHSLKVSYNTPQAQGDSAPQQVFNRVEASGLSLSFILDGTGVVPPSLSNPKELLENVVGEAADFASRSAGLGGFTDTGYVTRRIKELKKVVFDYNVTTHEPPVVLVLWGDVDPFKGRLEDFKVNYTLFNPDGTPLRAEIQLQFKQHSDPPAQEASAGSDGQGLAAMAVSKVGSLFRSSPDLTHNRTITQADTLTLMTESIYKDAAYYWQVAEANKMTHFRELEVGRELFFPPIER